MKLLHLILMISLSGFMLGNTTGTEDEAREYRKLLSQASAQPSLDSITKLGDAVYALTRYSFTPADAELRDELVRGMTAIPGHARFFADELERQRALAAGRPRRNQTEYDRWRVHHLCEILRYLPSPETVQILGEYLNDERDVVPPRTPAQDWVDVPENALLACYTLSNLGLREAPFPRMTIYAPANLLPEHAEVLPRTRAWFEEVKAGKRALSFLGQKIEYRFKPDGTWETTTLASGDQKLRDELRQLAPSPSAPGLPAAWVPVSSSSKDSPWPWLSAGVALFIAMAAWIIRKSKYRNTERK
jgi:hypothetical protein